MVENDRLLIQILLLALLGAGLWVMAPFISALLWGAILAFASWPLMRFLTRVLGGRETLAAGLLTSAWILIVALPLVWLGFNLADHIRDATLFVRDVQVDGLPDAPVWLIDIPLVGERMASWWSSLDQQGAALLASVKPYLGQVGNW
ncbi:MAG: AI-2E family transporter, partial [Pseudomonas sp.]|nr:AI-2E family transporter [Pseudomonas sp.]